MPEASAPQDVTPVLPETPTSVAPSVSLAASRRYTNGTVVLTATAENADGVQILVDGAAVAESAVFSWDTSAVPEGAHVLVARAGDKESEPITVTVDRTPPRLVATSPRAGDTNAPPMLRAFARFDEVVVQGQLALTRADGTMLAHETLLLDDTLALERAQAWGPTELRLIVSDVTDQAGNVAQTQTLEARVPGLGQLGSDTSANQAALAVSEDEAFLVYTKDGAVAAKRIALESGEETALAALSDAGADPALVLSDSGPVAAFTLAGKVLMRRFDGQRWLPFGAVVTAEKPRLALDPARKAVLAVQAGASLVAAGVPLALADTPTDYDFAIAADGTAYLAVSDAERKLSLYALAQSTWSRVGAPTDIQAEADAVTETPRLAISGNTVTLAWAETSAVRVGAEPIGKRNVFVSRLGTPWQRLGPALDLRAKDDAFMPLIASGANGAVLATFREGNKQHVAIYDRAWRFLAGSDQPASALIADAAGLPLLFGTRLTRVNVNPSAPPAGLPRRVSQHACAVPEDIADGTSIAATGCYADVPARTLIPAAVPYELISPLWTDGAEKRRFFVLPEGEKLGYRPLEAFAVPVGTVLAKEFYWNAKPMETRLLVKRAEARWTGYSFRWNAAGTDAVLLANARVNGDFDGHAHVFPSRSDCVRCHNDTVGGTIGLLSANLNRAVDYGETTADQLPTLHALGVLDVEPDLAPRLAASEDTSQSYALRSRSYLQANCVHCHSVYHTGRGEAPRWGPWYAPLSHTNLCDHNHIEEGSHETSVIWRRDQNFNRAGRMPPIGTLLTDPTNDVLLRTWIDTMQPGDCPPWDNVVYP